MTDWGTVPDWLAAIGTVGAFGASLWLIKRELEIKRGSDLETRWAQARRVAFAVATTPSVPTDDGAAHPERATYAHAGGHVLNASGAPIFDVAAVIMGPTAELTVARWPILGPGATAPLPLKGVSWDGADPFWFHGWVDFSDANDVRWRRKSDATLEEVVDPGAEPQRGGT